MRRHANPVCSRVVTHKPYNARMTSSTRLLLVVSLFCFFPPWANAHATNEKPIRVLIIDGRNNHAWESTTHALGQVLLQTGRFEVDVATAPLQYSKPRPRKPA